MTEKIYEAIVAFRLRNGYEPTRKEIKAEIPSVSMAAIEAACAELKKQGKFKPVYQ